MEEKILTFEEWKTEYHPGWYLNTQEWLKYKRKKEEKNK